MRSAESSAASGPLNGRDGRAGLDELSVEAFRNELQLLRSLSERLTREVEAADDPGLPRHEDGVPGLVRRYGRLGRDVEGGAVLRERGCDDLRDGVAIERCQFVHATPLATASTVVAASMSPAASSLRGRRKTR